MDRPADCDDINEVAVDDSMIWCTVISKDTGARIHCARCPYELSISTKPGLTGQKIDQHVEFGTEKLRTAGSLDRDPIPNEICAGKS